MSLTQEESEYLSDILRDKDLVKFKDFLEKHQDDFKGLFKSENFILLRVMHEMILARPDLMGLWVATRKFLRFSDIQDEDKNNAYQEFEKQNQREPLCRDCSWYYKAPFEETETCLKLGAHPDDDACYGGFFAKEN